MAFLFKSKKQQQEREKARERDRDAGPGSSGSSQAARGNVAKDDKSSLPRSTPTGSLHSIEADVQHSGSPDIHHTRRGPGSDPQPPQQQPVQQPPTAQQSDLPVSDAGVPPHCSIYLTVVVSIVSKCASRVQPERLPLPVVPAPAPLYLVASESVPSLWRRSQLSRVERRRRVHNGRPH